MKNLAQAITILAGTAAAAGCGLLARSHYERNHFQTVTYTVRSHKLPPSFDGFRIVFLADLHNNTFGSENAGLLEAIHRLTPDLIAVGGDMVVAKGPKSMDVPLHLMKALSQTYPVYYGLGNHERRMNREREIYGDQYDVYMGQLKNMGVHIMKDRSERISRQDGSIRITGLDLKQKFYKKVGKRPMAQSDLTDVLGDGHCLEYHILLAHSPLYFKEYAQWGADLVLAGHFHGGTIRLPFFGGVMTPNYMFFPEYDQGLYQHGCSSMVLSAGLGTHSINIRLNNRPQLILIQLEHVRQKERR